MKNQDKRVLNTVLVGALAAMVYVVTLFRFPLLGSKVHFANAVCLLAGLLLGPVPGGIAAGLGSALYDLTMYNEGIVNLLITFVSKFAMAWVCGMLAGKTEEKPLPKIIIACVLGALTYVALYMLKTGVYGFIAGNIWAPIVSKFPASIINAAVAMVAAPIFYHALRPALKAAGILQTETKK
ncbi:MAG: ECF transporter S component [Clostridia bacterium]|nr:ECF transporter S component [Clostridia bacterium]